MATLNVPIALSLLAPNPDQFTTRVVAVFSIFSTHPLRWAILFMFFAWAAYWLIAKRWNPLWLAVGADGRLSTSKFQFLVWTIPVLYVAIADVLTADGAGLVGGFSANLLIALGLSYGTKVGAQGIVVGYIANQPGAIRPTTAAPSLNLLPLIQDDFGQLDLGKSQMIMWTFVAVGTFLYTFVSNSHAYGMCKVGGSSHLCFPDINATLMVLMGLSQGTYLGTKLVTTNSTPSVSGIIATLPTPPLNDPLTVTLTGANLTNGTITVNGAPATNVTWSGNAAVATVANPAGTRFKPGDSIQVGGIIQNVSLQSATIQVTQ
jgi:hypothetical protein